MATGDRREPLDLLGCRLDVRPVGAPAIADIAQALVGVERAAAGALVLSFDPSATGDVEAFVAAEQRCCADLSWNVETAGPATRVKVVASAERLDVLEQFFARPN